MKFRIVSSIGLWFAIVALGFSAQSFAQEEREVAKSAHQGTLIEFDGPDASPEPGLGTLAFANNDWGEVVGFYIDTNLVPHGFIRAADRKISSFDAPGAGTGEEQGTLAFNVNPQGATAGIYYDASNAEHGFVRSPSGKIMTFDAPDGVGSTSVCEETFLNRKVRLWVPIAMLTASVTASCAPPTANSPPSMFRTRPGPPFIRSICWIRSPEFTQTQTLLSTVSPVRLSAHTPSSMLRTPAPVRSKARVPRPTTWKARSPAGLPLQAAEILASYGSHKRASMLTGCE